MAGLLAAAAAHRICSASSHEPETVCDAIDYFRTSNTGAAGFARLIEPERVPLMDHVRLMQVFVAVVEAQGFAPAARKLDLSPASVTRAVVSLEEALGVTLLVRTTRSMRLTEAGSRYFEESRSILQQIEDLNATVADANATPKGSITVTAPVLFGRIAVMPIIVSFLKMHAEVQVTAHFSDRNLNLIDENIDVAVRIGQLPDSGMRSRQVGHVRHVLCASPEYLSSRGTPAHPAELTVHDVVVAAAMSPRLDWRFGPSQQPIQVKVRPRIVVSSNDAAIVAVSSGFGMARLLSYQIADEVAAGRLKIILEDFEEPPLPVHILHRESINGSARVRAFIDHLAEALRRLPLILD
ncbi:LysR family transcriptional regulator [Pseudoxanthomonas wuyuanensis]|nr:LysR family transcriptional regulator [Pseudoxanthomonas wuyuanensis]